MQKSVVFIADNSYLMMKTAMEIRSRGTLPTRDYYCYKDVHEDPRGATGDARVLPTDHDEYRAVPLVGIAALVRLQTRDIRLVGVGEGTLRTIVHADAVLKGRGHRVETAWVTPKVDRKTHLFEAFQNGITVISGEDFTSLCKLDRFLTANGKSLHVDTYGDLKALKSSQVVDALAIAKSGIKTPRL